MGGGGGWRERERGVGRLQLVCGRPTFAISSALVPQTLSKFIYVYICLFGVGNIIIKEV